LLQPGLHSPVRSTGVEQSEYPLVDISVGSRFWAFDLARELLPAGMLRYLFTGYPAFSAERFGLPRSAFRSVWTHEPLNRLAAALHARTWINDSLQFPVNSRFDRIVARRLTPGADIFVGWSGFSQHSLGRASSLGMTTVVERGSAHIEWQRDTLQEESDRTGLPMEIPDPRMVDRELAEYATADYIAIPSEFVARTFEEHGVPRERLIVNPYGVDLTHFHSQRPLVDRHDGLRVIHVGRVSARKGVQYLVPAVGKVSGATLTLVGGVDSGMDRVINRSHTRVIGSVPVEQLPRYYAAADVYCLLSIEDGFAMTLTQAMAMGLPVITTSNVGAAELVTDGVDGFVVPPRDPDAVADRLRQLADDPAGAVEMGQRARAKVAQGFSWQDYGARARRAYAVLVADRRGVQ
jgi:glycosyltransferase involved in cell wall biosynthesis